MINILQELYGDDATRVQLAFNTEDAKILCDLADDVCLSVRIEVAGNENTPPVALRKLANDDQASVRLQVAGNEKADKPTIEKLLKDNNVNVAEEASYSIHFDDGSDG